MGAGFSQILGRKQIKVIKGKREPQAQWFVCISLDFQEHPLYL
jgi:hypothetical protein